MEVPKATKLMAVSGQLTCASLNFKVSTKRFLSPLKKYNGPPKNKIFPSIFLPCASEVIV